MTGVARVVMQEARKSDDDHDHDRDGDMFVGLNQLSHMWVKV